MSFKKHIWKGLAVAAAFTLSTGLMVQSAFAAASVTTIGTANVDVATTNAATGSGAYTALSNTVITTTAVPDVPNGATIIVNAPSGWSFNAAAPGTIATTTGATFAAAAATMTATSATWTTTAASTGAGTITISGLQIRPNTASSVPGSGSLAGTSGFSGTAVTVGNGGLFLSFTTNNTTLNSDGTESATLTLTLRDSSGAAIPNVVVTLTTNRGTLSATSNTTSTTTMTTGATGTNTQTFRCNGSTGTVNLTATTAAPLAAIATLNTITCASSSTSPTGIKFFSANNSGHVAASLQNQYTTPNLAARVRFQVTDGNGNGVNGQLIQATVDKGNIVQGDTSGNPPGTPGSCAGNNVSASDTSSGPISIDGTDYDGIVVFTVCGKAGQVGPIKVTAKNLSTNMADASTTITSAGVPNKIEATSTAGAVTVTIKDKDGNNVAEGTTVTFGVPSFTGTVAPTCTTTTGGKASAAAAFSGTGGQVLVTVFINDTGSGAASTCGTLGSSAVASTVVNIGAGGSTPPGGGSGGFTGAAPARGSIGLLVTNQASSAAGLVSALGAAGCTAESIAVLEGGVWKIYINGAPAVVNSAFPGSVAATTAFFVRCAA